MRAQFLLVFLILTACSSETPVPPSADAAMDSNLCATEGQPCGCRIGPSSIQGTLRCVGGGLVCECASIDAGATDAQDVASEPTADVARDATPLTDTFAQDAGDTPPAEDRPAIADRPDPCGSPILRECNVNGVPMCVNISAGRMIGGVVVHCGMCDVTCAAGEVCFELRCQRL